jgi:hypothetical protein
MDQRVIGAFGVLSNSAIRKQDHCDVSTKSDRDRIFQVPLDLVKV